MAVASCPFSAAALHECLIDLVVTVSPRQPRASRRPPCVNVNKSAQITRSASRSFRKHADGRADSCRRTDPDG